MEVPKLLGQLRGSPQAQRPDLRGASDVHCGKSQAPRHELQLLAGGKERLSNRDRLCLDIDESLAKKPHSFEAFLFLMEQTGYTITRRKNITFSHSRQKRNIRMRSLPEEYQKDAICEVLLGKSIHNLRKHCSPLTEQNHSWSALWRRSGIRGVVSITTGRFRIRSQNNRPGLCSIISSTALPVWRT